MHPIIATQNLSKQYQTVKAVDSVNLEVSKGEIYGFLGLNGAGKTTTIRMLLGMINPTTGSAFIKGQKVHPNKIDLWKNVGYLVEIPYSYPNLTVKENLEIIRKLRAIKNPGAIKDIMHLLQIDEYKNRKVKHLSLGNKQRLGLAKAMLHRPEILLLDEPTNGLDPAGIHEIRELLIRLAKNEGITIFVSSHILGEITKFTSRIGIIHRGIMIDEFATTELNNRCKRYLEVSTLNNTMALKILKKHQFHPTKTKQATLKVEDPAAINHPEKIASLLVNHQCPPNGLSIKKEDLESYFLRIIQSTTIHNQIKQEA